MSNENQRISDAVRSGRYFEDARAWFKTVYIGPVSERTFFLLIAALAMVVFFIAMSALIKFMPLTERPPAFIKAPDPIEERIPRLVKIKEGREDINEALQRFLIERYVVARESYSVADFDKNVLFVYGNSSGDVYEAYKGQVDPKNEQSYAAVLGKKATREVTVDSIEIVDHVATVKFTTEVNGAEDNAKSRWTAKLDYSYNNVDVTTVQDDGGDERLETTNLQFQVTGYAIESR